MKNKEIPVTKLLTYCVLAVIVIVVMPSFTGDRGLTPHFKATYDTGSAMAKRRNQQR